MLINLVVVNGAVQVCHRRPERYRLEPCWEFADLSRIIILFNMPSGTCNRYAVQHLEEVKIQCPQQGIRRPCFRLQLTPCIKGFLCLTENLFNRFLCIELVIDILRVALVCQRQLILQIHKTVINRGGRQHEYLRLYACPDHLVHQLHITVLLRICVGTGTVTEVMRLVDHDQIVISPVQTIQI